MWNCTLFMHPTDEHLRHADIFFGNYCNLQFVHFEWIYILRARASIIFMMSMILRSTVQRFFFSHRRRVINPKRLCFLKTFDSDISLRSITLSATAIKVYCVRPCLHGFGQISERTRTRDPRNRTSFWVLQSITVFARFRVNELHRSKICPDPRDLSVLRIWSTNSL